MVSENTLSVDLKLLGIEKLEKAVDQLEKGMGKTAQDLKAAVQNMADTAKTSAGRAGSSFMEYSKADKEGKQRMRDAGMGKSEKLGALGSKMMMGEKGFGGLAKDMKGMATQNIPMGKAFAAGGAAGVAMAGIGTIMGIVKKAFGSSSILNTVAKSFWTIMGTMADIILMPMLPYMFKFLQWMMTSVMPWVLKVSEGVSALLKGDLGPLYEIWWKLLWDVGVAIVMKLVPFLLKLPGMMLEGMGKAAWSLLGFHQGGVVGAKRYHGGGTVPGGAQSEELAVLQGGETVIPRMDTVKQSVYGWFGNTADLIEKTKNRLNKWADEDIRKEGSTGGFWQVWYDRMVGTSILPETKSGVQGWFTETEEESKSLKDKLFGWINLNSVGNFFKSIGDSIIGAFSALWGGKYSEGDEGFDNEPGGKPTYKGIWGFLQWIKDQIPSWDSIKGALAGIGSGLANFGTWVWRKISDLWGGKYEQGDPGHSGVGEETEYPGIYGKVMWILSKIPSWDSIKEKLAGIGGSLLDFGTWVWERLTAIWGLWEEEGGGIRGWIFDKIWSKIPTWDSIKTTLSGVGGTLIDIGGSIAGWFGRIWGDWEEAGGGLRGWVYDNTIGRLPTMFKIGQTIGGFLESLGLVKEKTAIFDAGGTHIGYKFEMKGMGDIAGDVGNWLAGVWGKWEHEGGGIRGWIYDNTIHRINGMLTSIGGWLAKNTALGEEIMEKTWVGGRWTGGTFVAGHYDEIGTGVYKMKGFMDIVGDVGLWLKNLWGLWEEDGGGIRGWIYDNTVGRISGMLTSIGGWLAKNTALGEEITVSKWIGAHMSGGEWVSGKMTDVGTGEFKMKGVMSIVEDVGEWLGNMWGKWEEDGGGIRGWIYNNTIKRIGDMAQSIGGWIYSNFPGGSTLIERTRVAWKGNDDDYTYEFAGVMDIMKTIGTKIGNMWGKWEAGGGGLRGWVYDQTVGRFPSMDLMVQGFITKMHDFGLAKSAKDMGLGYDDLKAFSTIDGITANWWELSKFEMKGFGDILSDIGGAVAGALGDIKDKLLGMLPSISLPNISFPSGSDLTGWIKEAAVGIRKKFADALNNNIVQAVIGWASHIPWVGSKMEALKGWVDKYKSGGAAYYGYTTGKYAGYWESGKAMYYPNKQGYGTPGQQGALLPGFQKGGIVPGPIGAPLTATVHGGETIIPAGATNNNQKVFNIQINSNLSAADIVKDIDLIDSMNTSAYTTALG